MESGFYSKVGFDSGPHDAQNDEADHRNRYSSAAFLKRVVLTN